MNMTNEELLQCIKAEIDRKKIECRRNYETEWWPKLHKEWNTHIYDYRISPKPEPKLVPHWPAIILLRGHYYLSHQLFHNEHSAKNIFENFIQLAIEYPPIMLEVKE